MGAAGIVTSEVPRADPDEGAVPAVVQSLQGFTADLYRRLAANGSGNLVCSPYSVAVVLAMARSGACGSTASEMDRVLHAPLLAELNAGLNALTQHLESRAGDRQRRDSSIAKVSLASANSLWGQQGITWQQAFLDTLASQYGAGMRVVDYAGDPGGAREAINTWTSDQTAGKIPNLVPAGALDPLTRLLLVNAIYLKAPWEEPFSKAQTQQAAFTRAEGSRVDVPMMSCAVKSARYASGPGWQAVDLPYAGRQLAMAVVVPGQGQLAAVERGLDGAGLAVLLAELTPSAVALSLPRWKFRTHAGLGGHLGAHGMPTAFTDRADFTGMTDETEIYIKAVLHEAFIAVDEEGTEAAAATAMMLGTTMALPPPPLRITVDRPFLFVIHDVETAIPLFIGRVDDPSMTGS